MLEPSKLKGYEKNARTHSKEQIQQIVRSIENFGFNVPVEINSDFVILSGHARVEAAKKLKLEKIPVIIQTHLITQEKQSSYIIAANKIALNADWDYNILNEEFKMLDDLENLDICLTGFSQKEIDEILGKIDFNPGSMDDQGALDILEPKYIVCPHCEKSFDLRELDK